jgi:hypothetical protein
MADSGTEGLGSWEDSAGDVLVCVWYVHFCCESVGVQYGHAMAGGGDQRICAL